MAVTAKRCSKCGVTKPVTEFSRDTHHRNGLNSRCRICDRARLRAAYEKANPDCLPYKPQRGGRCQLDGCNGRHKAHGYCQKHYQQAWKHGTPKLVRQTDDQTVEHVYDTKPCLAVKRGL